eukprot:4134429-Pyramimonas_sp.AAC.1
MQEPDTVAKHINVQETPAQGMRSVNFLSQPHILTPYSPGNRTEDRETGQRVIRGVHDHVIPRAVGSCIHQALVVCHFQRRGQRGWTGWFSGSRGRRAPTVMDIAA